MKNKLEKVNCLGCGKDQPKAHYNQAEWTVVECESCGFVYTNPRPTLEELPKYYTNEYFESDRFGSGFENANYFNRIKDILKYKKTAGSLLEIGSAKGHFLNYMKGLNWTVSGVEFSYDAARSTKENFDIDVFNGDFLDFETTDKFDVICLYQVLEHVPQPIPTIEKAFKLLKNDGILIIEVPNIEGYDMKINDQRKIWSYDLPIHLSHYTPKKLGDIVKSIGFEVKHIDRYYPQFILNYFAKKNQKSATNNSIQKETINLKSKPASKLPPKESLKTQIINIFLAGVSILYPGWRFTVVAQKK